MSISYVITPFWRPLRKGLQKGLFWLKHFLMLLNFLHQRIEPSNGIFYLLTRSRLLTHVNHEASFVHLWYVYQSRHKPAFSYGYKKASKEDPQCSWVQVERCLLSSQQRSSASSSLQWLPRPLQALLRKGASSGSDHCLFPKPHFNINLVRIWIFHLIAKQLLVFRLQSYSPCQAASFASTTSCTFGGFFW